MNASLIGSSGLQVCWRHFFSPFPDSFILSAIDIYQLYIGHCSETTVSCCFYRRGVSDP